MSSPDWKSLFGSLELCACEHCRSVLSPAAYLVDLLEFVRRSPENGGTTPFGALVARRGDIIDIKLSCENTNTPLPYIDLVNEILESAISSMSAVGSFWQTTRGADELAVIPEHVNLKAYGVLAKQPFPWTLPFDLQLERVRRFLEHARTSREEVMRAYLPRPAASDKSSPPGTIDVALATERLRLTPVQRQILTGTSSYSLPELWGWPTTVEGLLTELAHVPAFLRRSGISFTELLELLNTDHIDPDDKLRVAPADGCDTAELSIVGLTEPVLKRVHRFLRLWRALGWDSLRDLDRAFTAFAVTEVKDRLLVRLADMETLRAQFGTPIDEMLAWWAPIDVAVYETARLPVPPSLYDRLFRDPTVLNPPDLGLELPLSGLGTIDKHIPAILAALEITEDELALLVDPEVGSRELQLAGPPLADRALTLANLSALYRYASLARALELPIPDLLALRAMSEIDPFAGPASTVRFVEAVRRIGGSPFSIEQLDFLLRGAERPASPFPPSREDVDSVLGQLREALQAVEAQTSAPPDPSGELPVLDPKGELTRRMLAVVVAPDELEPAMAIIGDLKPLDEDAKTSRAAFIDAHPRAFPDAAAAKASLLAATPGSLPQRYAAVLAPLLPKVRRRLGEEQVTKHLGEALGLPADGVGPLLRGLLPSLGGGSATAMDRLLSTDPAELDVRGSFYLRLAKIAAIFQGYAMSADELASIASHGPGRGWLDITRLPISARAKAGKAFAAWGRLDDLYILFGEAPGLRTNAEDPANSAVPLFELFDDADAGAVPVTDLRARLATAAGWTVNDDGAAGLVSACDLGKRSSYQDERGLARLPVALSLSDQLGLRPPQLRKLCHDPVSPDSGQDVMQGVRAVVERGAPLNVLRPVADALREAQRDALVAHLVQTLGLQSSSDLHDRFLIDVDMSPCQLTSRIKQAIGSTQLFVQRILMHLEGDLRLAPDQAAAWKVLKSYRLNEANKRVFIHTENYIFPELRDDKTPFFRELETELLQDDVTAETAERAVLNYLEKLDEVSHLEICAICCEGGASDAVIHLLGRTRGTPSRYFYRRRNNLVWTPWEQVDVDLEGDHMLLVVYEHRLRLVWATFSQVANTPPSPSDGKPAPQPTNYWEVGLSMSVYRNGMWSPAVSSKTTLTEHIEWSDAHASTYIAPSDHRILAEVVDDRLEVRCDFYDKKLRGWFTVGYFVLDSCHGDFIPTFESKKALSDFTLPGLPARTLQAAQGFTEDVAAVGDALYLYPASAPPSAGPGVGSLSGGFTVDLPLLPVLRQTPGTFSLVTPAERNGGSKIAFSWSTRPFVFQDAKRTFLAIPDPATPQARPK